MSDGGLTPIVSDLVEKIKAEHHHVPRMMCRRRTYGLIAVEHQFSNRVEPVILRCTRREHPYTENHEDGGHCWRTHVFPDSMASPTAPVDEGGCVCGKSSCGTLKAITEFEEEL